MRIFIFRSHKLKCACEKVKCACDKEIKKNTCVRVWIQLYRARLQRGQLDLKWTFDISMWPFDMIIISYEYTVSLSLSRFTYCIKGSSVIAIGHGLFKKYTNHCLTLYYCHLVHIFECFHLEGVCSIFPPLIIPTISVPKGFYQVPKINIPNSH